MYVVVLTLILLCCEWKLWNENVNQTLLLSWVSTVVITNKAAHGPMVTRSNILVTIRSVKRPRKFYYSMLNDCRDIISSEQNTVPSI